MNILLLLYFFNTDTELTKRKVPIRLGLD